MDNNFTAKPVAEVIEKQPESNTTDSTMAVSSMEYNHKMDGQSNPVKMGVNDESANVSSASASQKGSQPVLDIPQQSDSRPKRKGPDNVNAHTNTSTPVTSQIIHVSTQKPKKGSFQITRVINRKQLELDAVDHAEDGDSIGDDFDETSETNTEDLSTDADFGATRFRIVKVSNEKFLRGRWTCYDYLDSERTIREKSNEDLGSGNSSAASSVHYVPGVDDPNKNPLSAGTYSENVVPGITDAQPGHSIAQSQITNGDYSAQSITSLGNTLAKANSEQQGAHEMPSSIVQSASAITNPISSQHSQPPSGTYTVPSVGSSSGSSGSSTQASQLPSQDYSNATSHQDFVASQQQNTNQQQQQQPQQQPSTQTIPQQSKQQPAVVPPTSQDFTNGIHNTSSPADSSLGDISSTPLQPQSSSTNINEFPQSAAAANVAAQVASTGAQSSNASPSENVQTSSDFRPPDQGVYISPADDQQSTVSAEDDRTLEMGLMKPFMVQGGLAQPMLPLLEMVQTSMHPLGSEDESGASTIAIDNKIEQAMDLVKSHLMFAVREEVLVLKEQIKELVEKNSQLEYENTVLRANASQETLSKLSSSGGSGGGSGGSGGSTTSQAPQTQAPAGQQQPQAGQKS